VDLDAGKTVLTGLGPAPNGLDIDELHPALQRDQVPGRHLSARPARRARRRSGKPLILIDLPPGKPGSDTPLYCVVEAQRRALRKDERAVGEPVESSVWEDFGLGMRERAGKFRVFCHWRFIDLVETVFTLSDFIDVFSKAVSDTQRDGN